jgi:hypothetical protein
MIKCEPLTGFNGWYVAVVPAIEGDNQGKPVQLSECGKFEWRYQCGLYGTIELVSGDVTISAGAGGKGEDGLQSETDLTNWSLTEPTIITMSAWQESPCAVECDEHRYTIRLYDPFCEANPDFTPWLRGTFNNWGDAVEMTMIEEEIDGEAVAVWTYTTDPITSLEFKWNNSSDKDNWANQFQYFVEPENEGEEGTWKDFDNFKVNNDVAKANNYVVEYDFSDETKYRYGQCGVEVIEYDETPYNVTVNAILPEGAPEAGVEIIGDFDEWTGTEMTVNEGTYTATVVMSEATNFKIREAGNWDNQIVAIDAEGNVANLDNILVYNVINGAYDFATTDWTVADPTAAVPARIAMDEELGTQTITIDFSDATKYAWTTTAPTGIMDIRLDNNQGTRKIMIDGQLYIIRNNAMFNALGTQVR